MAYKKDILKAKTPTPPFLLIVQILFWIVSGVSLLYVFSGLIVYSGLHSSNEDLVVALGGLKPSSYLIYIAIPTLIFFVFVLICILLSVYIRSLRNNRIPRIKVSIWGIAALAVIIALGNVYYGYYSMVSTEKAALDKMVKLQKYVDADYGSNTVDDFNNMWWQPSVSRSNKNDFNDIEYVPCLPNKTASAFEFFPDQIGSIDEANEEYIRYIDGYGEWEWEFLSSENIKINGKEIKVRKYHDRPISYNSSLCGRQDIYISTFRDSYKTVIFSYTAKESIQSKEDNLKYIGTFKNL